MNLARYPNDRYGWFCFYTDRWAQEEREGFEEATYVAEHAALWYYFLHLAFDGEAA